MFVRIHDEGAHGLEDECEEHRSTPPAVGASEGVGADAAEADAAAAASSAAGADVETPAFSQITGFHEGCCAARLRSSVQDARAKPRC